MIGTLLIPLGMLLVIMGFLVIAIAMSGLGGQPQKFDHKEQIPYEYYPESERKVNTEARGGGAIMLGPIPIIFGSDKQGALRSIILAIILMLLVFIFFR